MSHPIEQIIADVELAAKLPEGTLSDPRCRTGDISLARHVVCYFARMEARQSFTEIARYLGNFNEADVISGFNRISVAIRIKDQFILQLLSRTTVWKRLRERELQQ